ncbi:glycoside hydrolase family 10 protein [Pseudopedobacter beijingensis]|uniref:Glycoside hydrolase family 10 protein n=1 Tax=Pseudopedobacter beijingensis TaxID=1207056 RepID=A0ABW4IDI9_9SPHI
MVLAIRKTIVFIFLFILAFSKVFSQDNPKREFRGVWVATVKNIDWPSKPGLSTELQKEELIWIFDEHQKNGMNAIMFQVRPSADAFFAKGQELWSAFLSGEQGKAPQPFYDPLAFAIEEAHKRGMELHAWFNPYRATTDNNEKLVSKDHITFKKPEWFFTYGNKKYFNPGLPEVRQYINKVVMEVVRHYDIDGVHFDDYFYPYPDKELMPDTLTFKQYAYGIKNIADWRRHNVDLLIKDIGDSIKSVKKYVKYGISPSAIYRNSQDPEIGSSTSGFEHYSQLYADTKKWIKVGWIDYINPQLYFPFNYAPAAYEKLVDWWAKQSYGRHVYIGHGIYRLNEKKNGWDDPTQMPRQIRYLRQNSNIGGSLYFSSKSLTNNMAAFQDSLRANLYNTVALVPQMPWLDHTPPLPPLKLRKYKNTLVWNKPYTVRDGESAYGYVVYRVKSGEKMDITQSRNILKVIFGTENTNFTDTTAKPYQKYIYTVTAIDRLKNESQPANELKVKVK